MRTPYRRTPDHRVGIREMKPSSAGSPHVVAFPFAGGQSLAFRELSAALPAHWGLVGFDPPGHGWAAGPPLESVHAMAELYLRDCMDVFKDRPVLLGTSLGGCVAFALAALLEARGAVSSGVVLIGTPPPHQRDQYPALGSLNDERLIQTLVELGGIPAEWATQREMLDFFLPPLKADLVAFESFDTFDRLEQTPVLAVAGTEDDLCRAEHLNEWDRYASRLETRLLTGGHFLAQSDPALLAAVICHFAESLPKPI